MAPLKDARSDPELPPRRPRRPNCSAAARRAQASRAEGRTVLCMLRCLASLGDHRGGQPGSLGAAPHRPLESVANKAPRTTTQHVQPTAGASTAPITTGTMPPAHVEVKFCRHWATSCLVPHVMVWRMSLPLPGTKQDLERCCHETQLCLVQQFRRNPRQIGKPCRRLCGWDPCIIGCAHMHYLRQDGL